MRSAWIRIGLLACFALCVASCASLRDPLGRRDALNMAQKQYTEAIRWGYFDRARAFVEPEQRAEFEKLEPLFEDIRFTDSETGEIEMHEDEAYVTVTYRGYAEATQVERTFREEQHWKRVDSFASQWHVQSNLSEQVLALLGPAR